MVVEEGVATHEVTHVSKPHCFYMHSQMLLSIAVWRQFVHAASENITMMICSRVFYILTESGSVSLVSESLQKPVMRVLGALGNELL